jgi:HlyD family secretion protein
MATPTSEMTDQSAPWDTKKNATPKHQLRRFMPWLGLVILLGLIGWGLRPKPVIIETGRVIRGPLTVRVSEEGKTRVKNRYVVAAPVAGKMRRVSLKPGDEVTAGATLLTIIEPSPSPLLDPRARVQAEAAVSLREAARQQAAETLEAKRAAAVIALAERDRIRAVVRVGTISDSDRDRVEGDASIKSTEVRAAEFSLQVSDYEIAQSRAALVRPDAVGANNLIELKAPITGRVLKVMQESEIVVAAGTPILELGDPADLEIEAEILSRDAVAIRTGDSVEVEQWGGDLPLKARVHRVEPAAFTKISALGVEEQRVMVLSDLVDLPEQAKPLGDRFRVEARVAIWHGEDVLSVPAGAIFREGNEWKTYRFRDGTAALTQIEAGHSDGRQTEILSGLQAGDEVLLHPPDTVKDGSRVAKK